MQQLAYGQCTSNLIVGREALTFSSTNLFRVLFQFSPKTLLFLKHSVGRIGHPVGHRPQSDPDELRVSDDHDQPTGWLTDYCHDCRKAFLLSDSAGRKEQEGEGKREK